ncbi:hypothetical protein HFP57_17765 [Parasphingopyxis algicola]|uniref:hypothetical protein n=1 Tax=Parasphingopyxis algicola TaxID=2026624 RepID=UPI0015A431AF|nr:hypothetical protein [Parasphingopyxis algicola]QLC26701.1 hypothetical protein HFP57_17765 [Parasphingopyxis algicola]
MTRPLLTGGLAALIHALAKRAGTRPIVEAVDSAPWSSITFTGARHRFTLRFEGDDPAGAAYAVTDGLDYAEFDLGTYIVVDIVVVETVAGDDRVRIALEALILAND